MINSILRALFMALFVSSTSAFAGDLSWSGSYRIEGNYITNPKLVDSQQRDKDYGLHHLTLRPRIEATDGLTIRARLDLFNSSSYPNSQMGQLFGNGVGTSSTSADDSNTISQHQKSESIAVNELYITLIQEFGALVAGRAPMQFGLGVTYNAGNGMFDHYFDNRDVIGYKMIFGNFWFLPMMAKVNEGTVGASDDVSEYIAQMEYENPETDLQFGLLYRVSKINDTANDAPGTPVFGDVANPTASDRFAVNYLNVYVKKKNDQHRFGLEFANQDGNTGIEDSNGDEVKVNGMAIVGEYEFKIPESKWTVGTLFGTASGDDPNTTDKYEGYVLDRNYNVAMLLMNHQLGQANIFRTAYVKGGTHDSLTKLDDEAISNVTYIAPYFNYQWKEKWDIQGKLITGMLGQTENLAGGSKTADANIGYEFDFAFNYRPNKNILWSTEIGVLMPGAAFEVDGTYKSDLAYGVSTRAAINF